MSRFVKLTNVLLNTNYIRQILIQPNKYYIYVASETFSGFNFFGFGTISSNINWIQVCETKNPVDYKIISDWINDPK